MSTLLRLLSILCSLVVLVSFAMFASDQASGGSKETVARISSADDNTSQVSVSGPAPAQAKPKHGPVRRTIESANEKLVAPFGGVVKGQSPWTVHIVQALLGFLVFGVGIGFLARYAGSRGL